LLIMMGLVACGAPPSGTEQTPSTAGRVSQEEHGQPVPGALRWTRQLDGARRFFIGGENLVSDQHGGVLLMVNFTGTTDLGGGPVTAPDSGGIGLASYDSEGRLKWSTVFGTLGGASFIDGRGLAVDSHRDILFVVYAVAASGSDPSGITLSPGYNLVKLDRKGRLLWARSFRVDGGLGLLRLVTDEDDNIALAGSFAGTADFGSGPVTSPPLASSSLLARFDSRGENLWTYADTEHFSTATGVAVDSRGNLVLSGSFLDLTPTDAFVMMFSPAGEVLWARRIVGTDGLNVDVAVRSDRVVAVGEYFHSLTFAGQTLPPGGLGAGYIAAYTHEGTEQWIRRIGSAATRVAMDNKGCVFVMGRYRDGDDLGLGPVPGVPGSSDNLYVTRLDRDDGDPRWVHAFPATSTLPVSLALTTKNRPVALGAFDGTLRVDDEEWHSTGPLGSLFLLGFER
jgi:outer membrane protein assembly factor BamB